MKHGARRCALGLAALLAIVPPAAALQGAAEEQEQPQEVDAVRPHEEDQRRLERPSERLEEDEGGLAGFLVLDWAGLRSWMEGRGVAIDLLVTHDLSWAPEGGLDPGASASRTLFELTFEIESRALFGYEGGLFYLGFQGIQGENGSAEIGTLTELSNIDAENRAQLARVWYEHSWDGGFVRAGKIDVNSLFAYVDAGAHYLHSSMGYSPTILGLPTYPDPAFGLALGAPLGAALDVHLGVFDGAAQEGVPTGSRGPSTLFGEPADLFLIGELDLHWDGPRPGRLGLGAWQHTGTFDRFDGGVEDGTAGTFLVLDQRLWQERPEGEQVLDAFLQLGLADPDVSPFETHVGAGLAWTRPFLPRLVDTLGVGVTLVRLSDEPGAGFDEGEEIALETYYGFEPLPWLHFKPAVQYVINPGGDASLDDALVLTLRTTLSL